MAKLLDWDKLSDKDRKKVSKSRKLTFIAGPVRLSKRRITQIVTNLANTSLLLGCLKDEEIPGLEGSPQFWPLRLEELLKAAGSRSPCLTAGGKAQVLHHFHKDIKYIIKELKPSKVIFVNGSWAGQIHYRSEYWQALDVGAKVELVSPFTSEREGKNYEQIANSEQRIAKLYKKTKKYSDKELLGIAKKIAKASWDWIGQIGAVLAKKGRILAIACNRVVPYQAYQMHFGSIREKRHIPAQEMLETQLTNHAESEILEITRRQKINLKGTTLYINIFPCPTCAKMLSRTEIETIVYSQDHNLGNDFGYKVLEMSGKKLKRIV
jgi:deoxycytidylate deaminase